MLIFNTYPLPPKVDIPHTILLVDTQKLENVKVQNITQKPANTRISQGREIIDDSQLQSLKRQLFNQVNASWVERKTLSSDLVYKVAISANGEVISYEPLNQIARAQIAKTPLSNLISNPNTSVSTQNQPFGSFRVVFRKSGVLEISPWRGFRKTPDVVGNKITNPRLLRKLQRQLTTTLRQNWEGKTTAKQDLKYRVAVNKNGVVADYEPINQVAYDHFRETPLPLIFQELHGSNIAAPKDKEPLAHFRVVFKRNGSLDITPWRKLR
ncbi:hypothetical protein NIES4071_48080 [Calothrix sp. NIES-4071]|nr:hypothetical protein NIES4071_48080 [Calothrix sp. NIES-4071]BAZ59120.1 hypothetical protein NIES4105_48020 [Calothrix sp. NIES-4105]